MKILFYITVLFFVVLSFHEKILAQQTEHISFSPTYRSDAAIIDRPNTYDYEPSVMDDGQWKAWTCGGDIVNGAGGDSIFYTSFKTDGTLDQSTTPVLEHTNVDSAEDGAHACSPGVVKQGTSFIENGKTYYKMYYECARRFYSDTNPSQVANGGFTQICHAVSSDGIHWVRFNESLWDSQFTYGNSTTQATPVISVDQTILDNCKFKVENGKFLASFPGNNTDCSNGALNYGVGHPSPIVVTVNGGQQIWLFYYDSSGVWQDRGVYLAKSWDGFHFETPQKTNLTNPIKVKYLNQSINGHTGVFIGTMGMFNDNYLAYSYDGINWTWPQPDPNTNYSSPLPDKAFLKFGQALPNHCATPSQAGIVSDPHGTISSTSLTIFSGEGFLGQFDGCTATNGCQCYDPKEDASRGSTWAIYLIQGNLAAPSGLQGDFNGDGKVDIFDYNLLVSDFGKTGSQGFSPADINNDGKVDIFDYNILVTNFGKNQ